MTNDFKSPPGDGEDEGNDSVDDEYRVGYCRPPLHSQFQPRISGNPNGRPRGSRNFKSILLDVAMRKVPGVIGGRRRRVTNLYRVLEAVRFRAAQGDPIGMGLLQRYGMPEPDEDDLNIPKGVLIIGEKLTQEEWEEEYGHLAYAAGRNGCAEDSQLREAVGEGDSDEASSVIISPR